MIYYYRSLAHQDEIRLLNLFPAHEFDAPVRVRIEHHTRARHEHPSIQHKKPHTDIPAYAAISYAWGTNSARGQLTEVSDGVEKTLSIPSNVERMLRYLRGGRPSQRLWIDAICINQDDLSEKGHQVQQMGSIYAEATQVLIWIEPWRSPEVHEVIFDIMEGTRALDDVDYFGMRYQRSDLPYGGNGAIQGQEVLSFIRSRWFYRRWVIQEVAHASDPMLVSGRRSFDFSTFMAKLRDLCATNQKHIVLTASDKDILFRSDAMTRILDPDARPRRTYRMIDLLIEFHATQCSDDYDRLYALNSLAADPMQVDYSQSIYHMYKEFAIRELKRDPAALLGCAGSLQSNAAEWPSWVPDWRSSLMYTPISQYSDAGHMGMADVCLEDHSLFVPAFYVGTVQLKLNLDNRDWFMRPGLAFGEPMALIKSWHSEYMCRAPSGTPNTRSQTSSIFSDALSAGENPLTEDELLGDGLPPHSDAPQEIVSRMLGRTGFFTDAGDFGIGPRGVRQGDVLIRFLGSRTLIVLRPREYIGFPVTVGDGAAIDPGPGPDPSRTASGHARVMTVVGDCYVPRVVQNGRFPHESELYVFRIE
jgi:hypothetical protein